MCLCMCVCEPVERERGWRTVGGGGWVTTAITSLTVDYGACSVYCLHTVTQRESLECVLVKATTVRLLKRRFMSGSCRAGLLRGKIRCADEPFH